MKYVLIFLLAGLTIASCRYKTGSGNMISESRTVGNFDGISVGGGFEVTVKTGPVTAVVVEADDNIMKYIKITSSEKTLKIRTEGLHNYSDVHMKVNITTPSLKMIKASSSADVVVQDILKGSGTLTFKASSGSGIKAEVDAPEIAADASSGSTINLSGKTRASTFEASSGSNIKAWDLLSENAMVKASSGSSARVHASVSLNATASSGSSVNYHGAANVIKSVSSGASITKKD